MKRDFLWALDVNIEFLRKTLVASKYKIQCKGGINKTNCRENLRILYLIMTTPRSAASRELLQHVIPPASTCVQSDEKKCNFHFTGKLYDRYAFCVCFLREKKETKVVWRHFNWWQIKRAIWAYKEMSSSVQNTRNLRWCYLIHLDFSENILKNEIKAWLRAEYVKVGMRSLSAIVKGIDDVIEVKYGKMMINP